MDSLDDDIENHNSKLADIEIEVSDIFDAYLKTDRITKFTSGFISDDMRYNRVNAICSDIVDFYENDYEFGAEYDFDTDFEYCLRNKVKSLLKRENIKENKNGGDGFKIKPSAIFQEKDKIGEFIGKKNILL